MSPETVELATDVRPNAAALDLRGRWSTKRRFAARRASPCRPISRASASRSADMALDRAELRFGLSDPRGLRRQSAGQRRRHGASAAAGRRHQPARRRRLLRLVRRRARLPARRSTSTLPIDFRGNGSARRSPRRRATRAGGELALAASRPSRAASCPSRAHGRRRRLRRRLPGRQSRARPVAGRDRAPAGGREPAPTPDRRRCRTTDRRPRTAPRGAGQPDRSRSTSIRRSTARPNTASCSSASPSSPSCCST